MYRLLSGAVSGGGVNISRAGGTLSKLAALYPKLVAGKTADGSWQAAKKW